MAVLGCNKHATGYCVHRMQILRGTKKQMHGQLLEGMAEAVVLFAQRISDICLSEKFYHAFYSEAESLA